MEATSEKVGRKREMEKDGTKWRPGDVEAFMGDLTSLHVEKRISSVRVSGKRGPIVSFDMC